MSKTCGEAGIDDRIIKNIEELASKGNQPARRLVLDVVEAALRAADPYENARKLVSVRDGKLIVGCPEFSVPPGQEPVVFDLAEVGNIYLVGGGKAAQSMAAGIDNSRMPGPPRGPS